ncbi:MAG: iron-sulfur cluster assembly accessory protein [Rickettsiales bacterium]
MTDTTFTISDTAASRIAYLLASEPAGSKLRVAVMGGGCSGFQYTFDFDANTPNADDRLFSKNGANIVIDEPSLNLLNGSMLDYVESLGAAAFEIKNPNATASCGCGNSFAV